MNNFEIIILEDNQALAKAAAKDFMKTVVSAVSKRGMAFVAISGGSTPRSLFKLLAQSPYLEVIPWDKIHFFWADERLVAADDEESNYGQVQQLLFDFVSIDPEKIHPAVVAGTSDHLPIPDPQQAAQQYTAALKSVAAEGREFPRFDWLLLGMGADGHTASLFPGSDPDPEDAVIPVEADYEGRPAHRVSLTPLILNDARRIVLLVSGANKASVLLDVLHGPPDFYNLPAQRIRPTNGRLVWMLDKAAASTLG